MLLRVALPAGLIATAVLAFGCGPSMPRGAGPPITQTAPAKAFTHKIGIKFVVVPAGRVEGNIVNTEMYQALLMSAHEVTNAQYEKFVAAYEPRAKSAPKGAKHAAARKEAAAFDAMILSHKRSKLSPVDSHPVNNVTPNEAEAFCRWLTKSDPLGRKYKLPDIAEWEYAARGGLNYKPYPWGDEIDKTKACYNAKGVMLVGSFPQNKFGLYDMAGNVAEWVRTDDIPEHELRGGSWRDTKPEALRVTARGKLPVKKDEEKGINEDEKLEHHGFRVLCKPPPLK